jgi:hypothetical protein
MIAKYSVPAVVWSGQTSARHGNDEASESRLIWSRRKTVDFSRRFPIFLAGSSEVLCTKSSI